MSGQQHHLLLFPFFVGSGYLHRGYIPTCILKVQRQACSKRDDSLGPSKAAAWRNCLLS